MPQQRLCRKLRQYVPADTQQRLQETENPHRKSYTNYNRLDGKYPGIKYRWILNMFQTNVSGSHAMGSDTVRLPRLINTVGNAS